MGLLPEETFCLTTKIHEKNSELYDPSSFSPSGKLDASEVGVRTFNKAALVLRAAVSPACPLCGQYIETQKESEETDSSGAMI